MPTVTIQFVYFGSSESHTRQPRSVTTDGGFTPIPGYPGVSEPLTTGQPPWNTIPSPSPDGYTFAFCNLSGCTNGPLTTFSAGTSLAGDVGTADLLELHVYVPSGSGNGKGETGAVIDAFDATTSQLVDNDFVTVSPDPTGALTTQANVDGWVDTTESGYTITADHPNIGPYQSLPTTSIFDQWAVLTDPNPPATLVSGANLTPAKGETVYALAFYTDPVAAPPKPNPCQYLIDELQNISLGDFPNPAAYEAAVKALREQILECERAHGVLPTPGFNPQPDPPGRQ
jgi:hypothetical protein